MTERDGEVSRRRFLQDTGAVAVYAFLAAPILRGVAEVASTLHTALASYERSTLAQPKLVSSIQPNSIAYGTHPHGNSLDTAIRTGEIVGTQPSIVGFYTGGNRVFSQYPEVLRDMNRTVDMGMVPMLSWGEKLSLVDIPELARQLSQIQGDFLWRPWYEMNGSWARGDARWYGSFTDHEFIETWKRMREYFGTRVPHAKFVFSPNATDVASSFESLFPGPSWMEVVGFDGYNKFSFDPLNPGHYATPNLTPQLTFGPDIATIQRIAPNTPWFLSEVNAAEHPTYLSDALKFMRSAGGVGGVVFGWMKGGTDAWDERDWEVSLHPQMLSALQRELQQPYYLQSKDPLMYSHAILRHLLKAKEV